MFCVFYSNPEQIDTDQANLLLAGLPLHEGSLATTFIRGQNSCLQNLYSLHKDNYGAFYGILLNKCSIPLVELFNYRKEKELKSNLFHNFGSFTQHTINQKFIKFSNNDKKLLLSFIYGVNFKLTELKLTSSENLSREELINFETKPKLIVPKELPIEKIKRVFFNSQKTITYWLYILKISFIMCDNKEFYCFRIISPTDTKQIELDLNPFSIELFCAFPINDLQTSIKRIEDINLKYSNPYKKCGGSHLWCLINKIELLNELLYFI